MTGTVRHILVVEDNSALAGVITFNLQQAGHQVATARNGREAWQHVRENRVDLIITDHQMPEMSGTELCRRIREDDCYAGIPVIMLTAKSLEIDQFHIYEQLGVVTILPKPFSPAGLVKTVKENLETGAGQC